MSLDDYLLTARKKRSKNITSSSIEEFFSDRSRILFSAAFRRLQQKAQVFSLEPNASIRTRLTHSIEVSDVGKNLALKVAENLTKKKLLKSENINSVVTIVECACLLHDIGNPPFGHFGEYAIKEWFTKNYIQFEPDDPFNPILNIRPHVQYKREHLYDLLKFDGNPQGLRIFLKLQSKFGNFGLNLTYATIASCIKYPFYEFDFTKKGKLGIFSTEANEIKEIWEVLELKNGQRFVLAYLMEAADDIAYCLSDIQDGIEKKIISWKEFKAELDLEWKKENGETPFPLNSRKAIEHNFASYWSKELIEFASEEFFKNFNDFMEGTPKSIFTESSIFGRALESIKTVARKKLYRSPEAENKELAGFKIISEILECYKCLLDLPESDFELLLNSKKNPNGLKGKNLDYHWRLFNRLSSKHIRTYRSERFFNPESEWIIRAHLILDYISGMTDDYAFESYQLLSGIKI